MISRATIDKIYQTAIIEEVIGDFVNLKKSGSAWKGLSPFANEKTPSFFVVPAKGIYKDFSSGKGGNVIDFLMEHEKLSYPEALRWLAAKYNIEIEEEQQTEEQQQEKSERENLSIVTEFAAKYFQEQLFESEEGQAIGLSYFQERGFRNDIIRKFQLGYSPDKWDALAKAATEAGYNLQYLVKTGLLREREGGGMFDFFKGRVMFPIHNISGKVIAFGGRTLKSDKTVAKYFNSPESELYIKSNVLFGLHLAKNSIVKNDVCYLVEGYTDVISMHQAGIENVVASSGTSLTEGQIRLVKRYTPNITILYDGDSAGIKASFRGIDMILREGMNVKVVLFPDGDDPDSFARKNSSEEIQSFIQENAKDFITFKTQLLLEDAGTDPVKRAGLIRSIVESVALIPDAITRSVYIQECSRILNIQEQVLLSELNKAIIKSAKKDKDEGLPLPILDEVPHTGIPDVGQAIEEFTLIHQERDFIRLLLSYGERPIEVVIKNELNEFEHIPISLAEYLIGSLQQDEMTLDSEVYRKILLEYIEFIGRDEFPEVKNFALHQDQTISNETSQVLTSQHMLSDNWKNRHNVHPETEDTQLRKAAKDCIFRLKQRKVLKMIDEVEKEIEITSDEEKLDALIKEKMLLDIAKTQISRYFGSVII
ncbi:MAG: DNA primase [Flavobacteriales bacterium]